MTDDTLLPFTCQRCTVRSSQLISRVATSRPMLVCCCCEKRSANSGCAGGLRKQCLIAAIRTASALTHHPHVHMIVPGGGISPDGTRWIACRPNFLLAVARRYMRTGSSVRSPGSVSAGVVVPQTEGTQQKSERS
jgi:Putative transposase